MYPRLAAAFCLMLLLSACHSSVSTATCQSLPTLDTEHVVNEPKEALTADDYPFGTDYAALWEIGIATKGSWSDPRGNIGFELREDKTINDLLHAADQANLPDLTVIFTEQHEFSLYRVALGSNLFTADYFIRFEDRSKTTFRFTDNGIENTFDEKTQYKWKIDLYIPIKNIAVKDIKIAESLDVRFHSDWKRLIEFHNQRDLKAEEDNLPTTWNLYARERIGTFGTDNDEEKDSE